MRIFKVYKKLNIICLNVYFGEILIHCLKKKHTVLKFCYASHTNRDTNMLQ